ncbi:unnamed protein product [Mesocestoides corti]|uniref:Uncharacterized protein n=1 Tax=Mesocestoides corti TaxID=53468 RepID=A0A3P6GEW9_MESCO|nr:unnamed protein product [Mesocestoides corti]
MPSAAYLGISINGGAGLPQQSDSTTTSTGVSTDAYSLTTSSNFFSAAESSVESLRISGGNCPVDSSNSHSSVPRVCPNRLFVNDDEASPASSHFSTLSSHLSSSDGGVGSVDVDDISPPLSLLGASADNRPASSAAAAKAREGTLVAPVNSHQPDPFALYASYAEKEGDPATCDQIRKDIHRQFPFHELFCSKNSGG